jgi:hypothetical protein
VSCLSPSPCLIVALPTTQQVSFADLPGEVKDRDRRDSVDSVVVVQDNNGAKEN